MFLLFVLLSLLIAFSSSQFPINLNKLFPNNFGACTSPKLEEGRCIFLSECEPLNKTIIKLYLTSYELKFLQDSYCGHYEDEVVVCCVPDSIPSIRSSLNETAGKDIFPEPGICGSGSHTKIIGGTNAKIDEFPWTALLLYEQSNKKFFLCGGSLIHKQYVLTAAHCFHTRNNITNVRLGEYDLSMDIDCEEDDCADEPVDVGIESIFEHEQYVFESKNKHHDIALVKLARPIEFTDWIKPICLPLSQSLREASFTDVSLDVTGWGHTETAPISVIKLKAWVRGVRLEDCSVLYAEKGYRIQNTQICAIGENGQDTCEGDSGGPLIGFQRVNTSRPYYFIAGIVSFGPTPCGKKRIPGVYTKVSPYIDWIISKILN